MINCLLIDAQGAEQRVVMNLPRVPSEIRVPIQTRNAADCALLRDMKIADDLVSVEYRVFKLYFADFCVAEFREVSPSCR